MIAVQRDNEIAGGIPEPALVTAPIPAHIFTDHLRAQGGRHKRSAIGGAIVHHDNLVDKIRHAAQHALDALLLVKARDDDRDRVAFVHYCVICPSIVPSLCVPANVYCYDGKQHEVGRIVTLWPQLLPWRSCRGGTHWGA